MQALALAFCLGYENIYVAGMDLLIDHGTKKLYQTGRRVIESVDSFKSTGIYDTPGGVLKNGVPDIDGYVESVHPTSMQIDFLKLLIELFPETKILSVSETSEINEHISVAKKLHDTPWYSPTDKPKDRTVDWFPLPDTMPNKKK